MKTFLETISSFADVFFFLPAFLSKPFRNNKILYEIIDRYINIFFDDIQLEKENLKKCFGHQGLGPKLVFQSPDLDTSLPYLPSE